MALIGRNIIHFNPLPSTNVYALDLLTKSKPLEGTVISTDNQLSGKGQLNNKWESEANKNISLSVILYPDFLPIRNQFALNQFVSLAVWQTISHFISEHVSIKWPNDIYIGSNKVAGILIQNQIQGKSILSAVIGIGINVNQRSFLSNAPNPISIINVLKHKTNLENLRSVLFEQLNIYYRLLKNGSYGELNSQYQENLYLKEILSNFRGQSENIFQGTIKGVDESGRLQVLKGNQLQFFLNKEIEFMQM